MKRLQKKLYLSKRESQIMDIIYERGEAVVSDIMNALPDHLSNSSVRTLLRILERKGHIKHKERHLRYVYYPAVSQEKVSSSALKHLMKTFFNNSPERIVTAILNNGDVRLSPEELDRLEKMIQKAKTEGE
jgi:predicted transcriptional regulator